MKPVYVGVLVYNAIYVALACYLLYFRCQEDTLGKIPVGYFTWEYSVLSAMEALLKVTFQIVNWTFAHKYWVVSHTLQQALGNQESSITEST